MVVAAAAAAAVAVEVEFEEVETGLAVVGTGVVVAPMAAATVPSGVVVAGAVVEGALVLGALVFLCLVLAEADEIAAKPTVATSRRRWIRIGAERSVRCEATRKVRRAFVFDFPSSLALWRLSSWR